MCDPACGSGHFLIAAANRIAKRLAGVREHDPEPAPEAIRHALRDVVSRCIHGVDVNPMAVELCKVSLWLEALEPGRPLSFIDDRILCGNSLLGTTPVLIEDGIPDEAYKPLLGDDKDVLKAWRQHNGKERKGQTTLRLDGGDPTQDAASLAALAERQRAIVDDTTAGVLAREAAYAQITGSDEHERLRLAADTWVAAFTTPKQPGSARITTGVVRRASGQGRDGLSSEELDAVSVESDRYRPLHWHVAFPAIFRAGAAGTGDHGWEGGFDCVLGNPPWEHTELKEKEFFAVRAPQIAEASTGAKRKRLIEALAVEHPELYAAFELAKRHADGVSQIIRMSERYPLCGRGRINTYAIFAEAMRAMIALDGRLGVIVPTGIATDDTTKLFFADMIERGSLVSLYDFENALPLFPGVHRSYKFCLLTVASPERSSGIPAEFTFFAHRVEDLLDPERRFELTADDIALLNPNTKTCPIFRTRRDAEITKGIYRRVPVLVREGDPDGNPWGITFKQGLFNMTSDSHLFRTRDELEDQGYVLEGNVFVKPGASGGTQSAVSPTGTEGGSRARFLPLYEGRFGHQFNHRFASQPRGELRETSLDDLRDPTFQVEPQFWIAEAEFAERVARRSFGTRSALLGFRRVSRSTDERTCIAALLPWTAASYGWILATGPSAHELLALLGCLNSYVFDYTMRNALSQPSVPQSTVEQLPVPSPAMLHDVGVADSLVKSALALTWTSHDLDHLGRELGGSGLAPWDDDTRVWLRANIDAMVFHAYAVPRDDVDHILDTFPIVRRKDEAAHGEFRTKRLILAAYDSLAINAPADRPIAGAPRR